MTYQLLTLDIDTRGVASVTLNRPEIHNAFNDHLIAEITRVFNELDSNDAVRLAVLSGNGKSFCAGGDLNWMKAMKDYSETENVDDSHKLAAMFGTIHAFNKPLIGVIHGFALGGGSGLASVCDYVIAAENATFGFTETRLGLIPATIGPFVIEKIGLSAARAYFISGAQFSTLTAKEIGLVHRIATTDALAHTREEIIAEFLKAAPKASRAAKALVNDISRLSRSGDRKSLADHTVHAIARIRVGAEAQAGMDALLNGRKAPWSVS